MKQEGYDHDQAGCHQTDGMDQVFHSAAFKEQYEHQQHCQDPGEPGRTGEGQQETQQSQSIDRPYQDLSRRFERAMPGGDQIKAKASDPPRMFG